MKKNLKENQDLSFVGTDSATKSKVQQILNRYDERIQWVVRDALEVLKKATMGWAANQKGISAIQWAEILEASTSRSPSQVRRSAELYARDQQTSFDSNFLQKLLVDIVKKFTCCVKPSTERGRYIWSTDSTAVSESVSDRQSTNIRIERVLDTLDTETQTRVLDALEILKLAGDSGITVSNWAAKVKQIHSDQDFSMGELLKMVVKSFPFVIKRVADKTYGWDDSDIAVRDDLSQAAQDAMRSQLSLAKIAMAAMQSLGTFTVSSLAMKMEDETGYPIRILLDYATHIVNQFEGDTIEKVSANEYKIKAKTQKTAGDHVQALKNLMRRAGIDKKD